MSGPSGSGKTRSSLRLAYGMTSDWSKIFVIDTENGSADLYSDMGKYKTLTLLAPYSPERYIAAIRAAEQQGAEVIVIDSATHEWDGKGGCLEAVDLLGGKYQDWAQVTPRHRRFIDAMLQSSAHIVVTMRTKQDYAMEMKDGKAKVSKLGMKEVQREGTEYELTLNFSIEVGHHLAKASKDRTGLFMDKPEEIITEETGKLLQAWNESGAEAPPDYTVFKRRIITEAKRLNLVYQATDFKDQVTKLTGIEFKDENLEAISKALEALETPKPPEGPGTGAPAAESKHPTPPPSSPPGANGSDKPGLSEVEQAEIAAMAFGGAPTPPAPTPEAPVASPVEKPSTSASDVLKEYSEQITAADSVDKLNEVYGLITLDKRVIGSVVLDRALKGLVEKRTNEILGIPEKAPEPQVAKPAPEPPAGKCPSCDGKGVNSQGVDCAACEGTGIPKHA